MSSYAATTDSRESAKGLLLCGIIQAPLFVAVLLFQFFTRAGFDVRRVPISLLDLGESGWIQSANFVVTGLLALACAAGIRRAFAGGEGRT